MVVSIGSNISSLRAQRLLGRANSSLSTSFERLSSGQRINRASDDAAGLAVADRLRSDVRLQNTAVRNISDAISALSIAESALESQSGLLMRLAELAEQSANGTYSTRQRLSLNAEYQSLLSEYGRIGSTTSFNGIKLLANSRTGNPAQLILQAGINGSSNSLLSVSTGDTTSFSGVVRLGSAWPDFVEAYNLSELNQYFGGQMGTATVTDNTGRERRVIFGLSRYEDDPTLASLSMWDLEAFASNPSAPQTQVGTAIITVTDGATGQISNVDNLALSFADGKTARISFDFSSLRVSKDRGEFTEVPDLGDTTVLDFTSVFDVTTSRNALTQVQSKLSTLSSLRGGFGAAQSRLQIALQLATQSGEASAAAESRIRDADIAQESSLLVRNQILQQIGAAVLAQANQAPALALSLLRG